MSCSRPSLGGHLSRVPARVPVHDNTHSNARAFITSTCACPCTWQHSQQCTSDLAEYQAAKTPVNKTREALEQHQGNSGITEALPRLKRPQGGKKRARKSKPGADGKKICFN